MDKKCYDCVSWVTCIYRRKLDEAVNFINPPFIKTSMVREWINNYANFCPYHTSKQTTTSDKDV